MTAYVIVDIVVEDPDRYEEYKTGSTAALAAYGGKFLVRGGETSTLEGDWIPNRMVVLEFESAERARAWWESEEYAAPKALRQAIAKTQMVLVQGAS